MITATRTLLASDPNPLVNTVTVRYNPAGFPNVITDTDDHSTSVTPVGNDGCTPGFWKNHPTEAVWGPTGYNWPVAWVGFQLRGRSGPPCRA